MKFFMVSQCGEGACILHRIQEEGNKCKLFIRNETYKTVYDGILEKAENVDPDPEAIVIFDFTGDGDLADALKKGGHKVFGGSKFADKLENDRMYGIEIMQHAGISVPLTKEFKEFSDGIAFVKAMRRIERMVFKPSGSMPCKLTYCAEDSEDMVKYLNFVQKRFGDEITSFLLQEYKEGVPVSSEIYFQGDRVAGPPNHTIEVKKFMNDDLGPSTGCSGNFVWDATGSAIARLGIMKMEDILEAEDFYGQLDLNAIVCETGIFGLEWTPRFGYDSTPTYLKMIQIEYGRFFADLANCQAENWANLFDEMYGIRLSIPPYPIEPKSGDSEHLSPNIGIPIVFEKEHENCYHFYEVMKKDDEIVHAGGTGLIACVIAPEINEVYEILEETKVPDKQYRTDLECVLCDMKEEALEYA